MLVLATATLLVALGVAFAATTARAQDAVPTTGEATPVEPPAADQPPAGGDSTPIVPTASPDPVPQTDPGQTPETTDPQEVPQDSAGPGDTAGTGGGGDVADVRRQPAHVAEESAPASTAGSTTPSSPSSTAERARQPATSTTTTGYPGSWLGQDTFIVDRPDGGDGPGPGAFQRPLSGVLALGGSTRATRLEATQRRSHETAKVSALGGPPGFGSDLPGQNPFFNLLSGPGGVAAGLALASIFAVLGAAFVLPRDRSRRFRTPAVSWRPLAYAPPIELPG
jgi:hypothetical protein